MNHASDNRLINQVRDLQGCLTAIGALAPLRVFNVRTGRESIALSAQDAQSVVPELISSGADGYLQLDYELLTVHLVGAIKELNARLKTLEDAAAPAA